MSQDITRENDVEMGGRKKLPAHMDGGGGAALQEHAGQQVTLPVATPVCGQSMVGDMQPQCARGCVRPCGWLAPTACLAPEVRDTV